MKCRLTRGEQKVVSKKSWVVKYATFSTNRQNIIFIFQNIFFALTTILCFPVICQMNTHNLQHCMHVVFLAVAYRKVKQERKCFRFVIIIEKLMFPYCYFRCIFGNKYISSSVSIVHITVGTNDYIDCI